MTSLTSCVGALIVCACVRVQVDFKSHRSRMTVSAENVNDLLALSGRHIRPNAPVSAELHPTPFNSRCYSHTQAGGAYPSSWLASSPFRCPGVDRHRTRSSPWPTSPTSAQRTSATGGEARRCCCPLCLGFHRLDPSLNRSPLSLLPVLMSSPAADKMMLRQYLASKFDPSANGLPFSSYSRSSSLCLKHTSPLSIHHSLVPLLWLCCCSPRLFLYGGQSGVR